MTDLDEVFGGKEKVPSGSTGKVIELLAEIKGRLQNAVNYKSLAEKMDIKESELLRPKDFSLDLSVAHDNEVFNLPGSKIVISEIIGDAELRFKQNDKPISLRRIHEIPNQNGFRNFYISNDAQAAGSSLTGLVTNITGARSTTSPVISNLRGTDSRTITDLFDKVKQLDSILTGQTNKTGLAYGQLLLAAASTAEALNGGTSLTIPDNFGVRVTALKGNAGNVYIGDSGVTESNGYELAPKAGIVLYITDVSTIYVIGPNAGDGVSWIVEQ